MKVQFKLKNSGNGPSYNTTYEIVIQPNLVYVGEKTGSNKMTIKKNNLGQTILTFEYNAPIIAGELKGGIIYLNYSKICDDYEILSPKEKEKLSKELAVAQESLVYMDLENSAERKATQYLRQPLNYVYTIREKTKVYIDMTICGRRKNPTITIEPKIKYLSGDTEENIQIYIGKYDNTKYDDKLRTLEEIDNDLKFNTLYTKGKYIEEIEDKPNDKQPDFDEHEIFYTVIVYTKDGLISSSKIKYSQNEIGLSTTEVVLIIISIIFYLLSAFFIWRGYITYKYKEQEKVEEIVRSSKLEKLI